MKPKLNRQKLARTKRSCLFYAGGSGYAIRDDIRCSLTTYQECHPETCPWYLSQEMADESYERARQIWAKNHGKDNYYELGYGPKRRMNPRKNPDEEEQA